MEPEVAAPNRPARKSGRLGYGVEPVAPLEAETGETHAAKWSEAHGRLSDLSAFQLDILPLLRIPLGRLQRVTGLSPLGVADPARERTLAAPATLASVHRRWPAA